MLGARLLWDWTALWSFPCWGTSHGLWETPGQRRRSFQQAGSRLACSARHLYASLYIAGICAHAHVHTYSGPQHHTEGRRQFLWVSRWKEEPSNLRTESRTARCTLLDTQGRNPSIFGESGDRKEDKPELQAEMIMGKTGTFTSHRYTAWQQMAWWRVDRPLGANGA